MEEYKPQENGQESEPESGLADYIPTVTFKTLAGFHRKTWKLLQGRSFTRQELAAKWQLKSTGSFSQYSNSSVAFGFLSFEAGRFTLRQPNRELAWVEERSREWYAIAKGMVLSCKPIHEAVETFGLTATPIDLMRLLGGRNCTQRTIERFIASYQEAVGIVRAADAPNEKASVVETPAPTLSFVAELEEPDREPLEEDVFDNRVRGLVVRTLQEYGLIPNNAGPGGQPLAAD